MKQRLIGAAVLVALAVIFLPMLISGPEPDSGTSAVPVDLPNRDNRDFQTRDLTLAPPIATPAPPSDTLLADEGDRVATVDTTGQPARMDAVSGQPVGRPEPQVSTPPAQSSPAPIPPRNVQPSAPVAEAAAVPEPRAPAAASTGRWAVNLGSYANAGNASNLVTQLRQQRLPAYAEQISLDGKPVQRVRLGPFAQRSEAESARLTVQRLRSDLPTGVISLEGESAPPSAVRAAVAEGFAVQLGAFRSEADANALRDRARAAGLASYVERIRTDSSTLWRVRLGPELKRPDAERLKADARAKLGVDGNIVPHP